MFKMLVETNHGKDAVKLFFETYFTLFMLFLIYFMVNLILYLRICLYAEHVAIWLFA